MNKFFFLFKNFFYLLFEPSLWIQVYPKGCKKDYDFDQYVRNCIEKDLLLIPHYYLKFPEIALVHLLLLPNNTYIWVANYPHCFGYEVIGEDFQNSKKRIYELTHRMLKEYVDKKIKENNLISADVNQVRF